MNVLIEDNKLPDSGRIHLDLTFDVRVTAEEAQETVHLWIHDHISTQLISDVPTFVLVRSETAQTLVWRTPIRLTRFQDGSYPVCTVDVSAVTGKIIEPDETEALVLDILEQNVRPRLSVEPLRPHRFPDDYRPEFAPMPYVEA